MTDLSYCDPNQLGPAWVWIKTDDRAHAIEVSQCRLVSGWLICAAKGKVFIYAAETIHEIELKETA